MGVSGSRRPTFKASLFQASCAKRWSTASGARLASTLSAQMACSIDVGMSLRRKDRHRHDLDVESQGPIVDVIKIMLDPAAHFFVGGDFTAQAANLRPAGDARLDVVPARVAGDATVILLI